jgi:hypothetical protein
MTVEPPDICRNYHGGNPESVAANRRNAKGRQAQAAAVFDHVVKQGAAGATCWEVEQALGLSHQSASARLSELKARGRLRPNGKKRKTASGSSAAVLVTDSMHWWRQGGDAD